MDGTVHRGSNMTAMQRQRYSVIGLQRQRNFGGGSFLLRSVRMLLYWARVFAYGWRRRKSIDFVFVENTHAVLWGLLAKVIGVPCVWDIEGDDALYMRTLVKPQALDWLVRVLRQIARRSTISSWCPAKRTG